MTTTPTTIDRSAPDLGRRFGAGVIDAALLGLLTIILTLAPLFAGGLALPILGVFVATIAYVIVPMAAFQATLGMRIVGLRIVGADGRTADATDLLFRELIGRGLLGFAYFATVIFGFLGYLTGAISFFQPEGFGLVLFLLSSALVLFGTVSHVSVLVNADGRGLHDRIAKTTVVAFDAKAAPAIDDEAAEMLGQRSSSRTMKIFMFEAALILGALFVPYLLSRPEPGIEDLEARTKLKAAAYAFEKDPADAKKYRAYTRWLVITESTDELEKARLRYGAAVAEREMIREAAVRKSLEERPTDWDTMTSLLRILEGRGAKDEARSVFKRYVDAEGSATSRASYGVWLYDNSFTQDAISELTQASTDGADNASVNAYLGWAYEEAGDKAKALEFLQKSMEQNPDLDKRILDDVQRLLATVGPE